MVMMNLMSLTMKLMSWMMTRKRRRRRMKKRKLTKNYLLKQAVV